MTLAALAAVGVACAPVASVAQDAPAAQGPIVRLLIGEGSAEPSSQAAVIALNPGPGAWLDFGGPGQDDLTCLTQAIYYEARSESLAGQRAVAQVVLNRRARPEYPSSVCGVVFERTGSYDVCQFTFACDGAMDRPIEPAAWDAAQAVAKKALAGFVDDPMREATHFHAVWVAPAWSSSLTRLRRIGGHVFYR